MSKLSNIEASFGERCQAAQATYRRFWIHFFILLWLYGGHASDHRDAELRGWSCEHMRTSCPHQLVDSSWSAASLSARIQKYVGIHFVKYKEITLVDLPLGNDVHVMHKTRTAAVLCFLARYKALPTLIRMNSKHLNFW
jgi:hypothetical protein